MVFMPFIIEKCKQRKPPITIPGSAGNSPLLIMLMIAAQSSHIDIRKIKLIPYTMY